MIYPLKISLMDKRLKLALVALLGLSTACSSVKNSPKKAKKDKTEKVDPRVVVMYGVRPPKAEAPKKEEVRKERIAEDLEPVVEDTQEE